MAEIERFKSQRVRGPRQQNRAIVEDLSGWKYEQLWGRRVTRQQPESRSLQRATHRLLMAPASALIFRPALESLIGIQAAQQRAVPTPHPRRWPRRRQVRVHGVRTELAP